MEQKQSLDLRPGKRFGTGLSNENLRIGANSARNAKRAGTLDESPMAYKDTDEIKSLITETCDIKFMLVPKISIKSTDEVD
jgi:hypothetical protein